MDRWGSESTENDIILLCGSITRTRWWLKSGGLKDRFVWCCCFRLQVSTGSVWESFFDLKIIDYCLTLLSDGSWNLTAGQRRRQSHIDLWQYDMESGKMRRYNLDFGQFQQDKFPGTGDTGKSQWNLSAQNLTVEELFFADPGGPSSARWNVLLSTVQVRTPRDFRCLRVPVRGYLWVLTQQFNNNWHWTTEPARVWNNIIDDQYCCIFGLLACRSVSLVLA